MTDEETQKDILLTKIRDKRAEILIYLARTRPVHRLLTNMTIFCSGLTAMLTAGPGLGGKTFSEWLTATLELSSPLWQSLCLLATIFSVAATIASNLSRTRDYASTIHAAQTCDVKLEQLQTLIEMEQVNVKKATAIYTRHIAEISFI